MAVVPLVNPSFETGNFDGWTVTGDGSVTAGATAYGTYKVEWNTASGPNYVIQTAKSSVFPEQSISASAWYHQGPASSGRNTGVVLLRWYNSAGQQISESPGNIIRTSNGGWQQSRVTAPAPTNAAYVSLGFYVNRDRTGFSYLDNFEWNLEAQASATLLYPQNGVTYNQGDLIPFRVQIPDNAPPVTSVSYTATNVATAEQVPVGTSTVAPYAINFDGLGAGQWDATATVVFSTTTQTTTANRITVGAVDPTVREFKASNSYTYLIGENFARLASGLPPTAVVTGVELVLDYRLAALIRSKDIGVDDLAQARYQAAFDMVPSGNLAMALLSKSGSNYTVLGSEQSISVPINRTDFELQEDGTSEGKRWTVLAAPQTTITLGAEDGLFGFTSIPSTEFTSRSVGLRFYPTLAAKPDYADTGDAVFRIFIDRMRLRVYFDAGSVEYYFVSPDGTNILKGQLAAYCVDEGDWESGDAAGDLQLKPTLEVVQGTSLTIGDNWTIHAQNPPNASNQIGVVNGSMSYNGLPGQVAIMNNRSRYQIISANFYGDPNLDSMYGVHGLPRAFSYNGEFFYKICTQPDPAKDSPRHVAFHQTHLALGYKEGRVDISVVGEPYNFNGALGASSWATGDRVTGLLPLTGTILGVYGSKSIVGISGTTVDNFALQTINAKMGATEYTVTDMGFPVHANSYGIYTLEQTASYGQYLGTPLSQAVSPWLRPRLVRSINSDKEVVCAWPVRSKNQYRLAFADGFVLTQTMNNGQQSAPTYSLQKYFWTVPDTDPVLEVNMLEYPAIYPVAVSSEIDDTGAERIHVAHYRKEVEV